MKVLADRRAQKRTLQDASRAGARPAASEGHAFFERRRSERLFEEHRQRVTAQVALDTHERLTAIATDALTARPQDPALSGYDGEMALNGVYLVDAASLPAFQSEVAALQTERAGAGFSLVVTGPWPPHHFIKVRAVESPVASEAGA